MIRRVSLTALLTLVTLVAGIGSARCADDSDVMLRQLKSWNRDLGHDQYAVRSRAMRLLREAGAQAVGLLAETAETGGREASYRAFHVLQEFASSGVESEESAASAALLRLSESPERRVASRALSILSWRSELVAKRSVDELRQLGANVRTSYSRSGPVLRIDLSSKWSGGDEGVELLARLKNLNWLSFEHSGVTDDAMPVLRQLDKLEYLYLGQTEVTSSGLNHLHSLTSLKYLSLEGLAIDDAGMERVGQLTQLESLGLDGTKVGDASAPHLARLTNLTRLWLSKTRVTDKTLTHLTKLKRLQRLYLEESNVNGPGLADLQQMTALDYLSLKRVKLDEQSMRMIAKLSNLSTLGLDDTGVTDDMVKQLSGLKKLQTVWLSKTGVGDEGLMSLANLPKLRTVFVHGAKVTEGGEERFIKHRATIRATRCTVHR